MLDELDIFLSINEELHGDLESRKLSKQALVTMVLLIKNISDYVCENTKKHAFGMYGLCKTFAISMLKCMVYAGNFLSQEHVARVTEFKKQFERATKQFSANVQMETLQIVLEQRMSQH